MLQVYQRGGRLNSRKVYCSVRRFCWDKSALFVWERAAEGGWFGLSCNLIVGRSIAPSESLDRQQALRSAIGLLWA